MRLEMGKDARIAQVRASGSRGIATWRDFNEQIFAGKEHFLAKKVWLLRAF